MTRGLRPIEITVWSRTTPKTRLDETLLVRRRRVRPVSVLNGHSKVSCRIRIVCQEIRFIRGEACSHRCCYHSGRERELPPRISRIRCRAVAFLSGTGGRLPRIKSRGVNFHRVECPGAAIAAFQLRFPFPR